MVSDFTLRFADIEKAYERIGSVVRRTPLLWSGLLSRELGRGVYIKAENLQLTGSFKFRGASHKLSLLSESELARGVVAHSSGNHGQAVAAAASALGCQADIVMPSDCPQLKIDLTRAWGGRIHFYDRATEDRAAIAKELSSRTGGVLVPPYDDAMVIAGQGTVGYEIRGDCENLAISPAAVLTPCGGGGLSAGVAVAMSEKFSACDFFIAEPIGYDDTIVSLRSGERQFASREGSRLCDALLADCPGELTFALNSRFLSGGFAVSDADVVRAMFCLFRYFKVVAEPGGAVGLAALLAHNDSLPAGDVIVIVSGGNIDFTLYRELLSQSV